MKRIDVTKYKSIVILTVAGISVASGLRPFRGPGGIWEEIGVEKYGSKAILENRLNLRQQFTLITQNIDGLHQRAGSKNVIELHGTVQYTRCTNDTNSLLK